MKTDTELHQSFNKACFRVYLLQQAKRHHRQARTTPNPLKALIGHTLWAYYRVRSIRYWTIWEDFIRALLDAFK